MSRTKSLRRAAFSLPSRSARVVEFVFRRLDATGDFYPHDAMEGTVPGPDPDRVVFMGERGELSLGVRTHEVSLPAFFARHRAARTARGVSWKMLPAPSASVRELPSVIAAHREDLGRCDLVVVLVGITDALRVLPTRVWEQRVRDTIAALREVVPVDAEVVIGEIPPLDNAGSLSRPARLAAGVHGRRLNARTRLVVEACPRVRAVGFPDELTRSVWRPESDEHRYRDTYKVWGGHLDADS
ncbi:hypothetical protein [Curtobacterium sp. PhB146]|uniref:hypothetical protein n=1 Tax=Curtobacterium sp. PhB146 TaxID=2485187 RepID=UPI0010452180|nr:hypothetical protein [Curtobacterium sp. PhB146]TCU44613.1 hypothetical protein EDF33_1056 [Curtobacterium sp. PhB146]